ncbi:ABC-2 transporter permease [Gracilibacillus alcaliphilus]|uniref:ABC-2 transporter permease n=1 Tax=Gracilibacillus alcaliphilus TaxID=1401441 RepID=UPI0019585D35|nr:ABC-2 transporter permease [Gracilibacillus alcaliphilus]MBM7678235.1 ABC-2 type transport system permease protein [Gracilibacillus alcaliphilus]
MFNLIKKDVIIQKAQILLFIPLIMFFAIFAKHVSPAFIFFVASTFIPLNAYIYDERVESNILLNSLPYTRKEIVAARYLGAIVYMLCSIGAAGIILLVFNYEYMLRDIAIAAGLFFLFTAFAFPLFYILKPGYIGMVVLISIIALAAVMPPVIRFLAKHLTSITEFLTSLSMTTIYFSSAGIAIGLYLLSWLFSQFIYQRKAF